MANPVGKVDENKIEKIMKGPIKQNSEGEVRAATKDRVFQLRETRAYGQNVRVQI